MILMPFTTGSQFALEMKKKNKIVHVMSITKTFIENFKSAGILFFFLEFETFAKPNFATC